MGLLKRGSFFLATLIISLALAEVGAQIIYRIGYGQWYRSAANRDADANAAGKADASDEPLDEARMMIQRALRHPYLGYIRSYDALPAAETDLWNLAARPQKRGSDRFVVGLFGGSVAQYLAPTLKLRLEAYFAEHHPAVRPVLLTLASGGYKQPQQVIALAYALSAGVEFDSVVALDGYNEVNHSLKTTFHRGVSPFYPRLWDLVIEQGPSAGKQALLTQIAELRMRARERTRGGSGSLLRHSAIYGLLEAYRMARLNAEIARLDTALAEESASETLEARGAYPAFDSDEAVAAASVETWLTGSRLMAAMARATGASYLHVLQPNQYVASSKPLTARERATAYRTDSANAYTVRIGYPLLIAAGPRLRAEGIDYHDATQIFADRPETLYIDTCCHVNETGNRILADFILERMFAGHTSTGLGPTERTAVP